MATVAKNYKKFSKIYIANSDFSTTQKNLIYSINVDSGEIKYAYYVDNNGNSDLIYNSEGSGYFIGAYTTKDNVNSFQPNAESLSSYHILYTPSYTSYTFNFPTASVPWKTYDWETGETSTIGITSYYRNLSGTTNNVTPYGLPKINSYNTTLQHRLISSNDGSTINTYSYQWDSRNRTIIANKQKVWFNIFQQRQAYVTSSTIESNYGNMKKTSNTNSRTDIKVYYNTATLCDFKSLQAGAKCKKELYPYQFLPGLDIGLFNEPITPASDSEYFTYIYQTRDRTLDRANDNSAYNNNTRCNFGFNCIHTNYNGDTYYYWGKEKTLSRKITCYFTSYQQLNSYTTTLVTPQIHDNFVGTINMYLAPYILMRITISIDNDVTIGNTNWEDIDAEIFFNPVGENGVYSLNNKANWSTVNNSGLNQNWLTFINSQTGSSMRNPEYTGVYEPSYDYFGKYKYLNPTDENQTYYYEWRISSVHKYFTYCIENIPEAHDFPDEISKADITSRSYYHEYDEFVESVDNYFYYNGLIDCTNNRSSFVNDGKHYIYKRQFTPDIDGQNEYTEDYVLDGQSYLRYTDYDSSGNPVGSGIQYTAKYTKPYSYDTKDFYTMIPWTYHDKDINIIIINRNLNYTPSNIEYKAWYKNDEENSWHIADELGPEIYNTGSGVKGQCFKYVHNVKVNHANTRGVIDYWNWINIEVWQHATGDYRV